VLRFSVGFGRMIWSRRYGRDGTEWALSAIPLGGYVKMAGENPDDARTGASDEFLSKSKWQRFQVLIMGPVMNLVLAVVVMAAVLYQGAPAPAFMEQPTVVGTVLDQSVLKAPGLQPGDHIVSVDGDAVPTWEDFLNAVAAKSKRTVSIHIEREGKGSDLQFVPTGVGKYDLVKDILREEGVREIRSHQPLVDLVVGTMIGERQARPCRQPMEAVPARYRASGPAQAD